MRNIILFCVVFLLAACGKGKETKVSAPLPKLVSYTKIKDTSILGGDEFSGKVESSVEADISFRVPGTIEKKYVFLGDPVTKGQTLAVLDDSQYKIDYKKSIASLKNTEAQLLNARQNYIRVKTLYFNDDIAKSEYDNAVATLDSSKAQYQAALEEMNYSKLQLSYTKLVSLTDGYISKEGKEVGENVKTGEVAYSLVSSGKLNVKFSIPEKMVNEVSLGSLVEVRIDTIKDKIFKAKIINIGSSSVDYGNTYPVKATLLDIPKSIKSGMSSKVYLKTRATEDILVPIRSVMTDSHNKNYVFKVTDLKDSTGVLKKIYIVTGDITNKGIVVLSGLKLGDIVVDAGMSKTKNGERVEVPREVRN